MKQRLKYLLENWKMVVHLLFKTGHFGVNNAAWSRHRSIFAAPGPGRLPNVLKNYKMMRIRAFSGFIPLNQAIKLFPGHAGKQGYTPIRVTDNSNKGKHP
ncbi:MAG: hypothetical protein V1793_23350 [Pseudomonadota bacterium]